jgi:chitinase
MGYYPNWSQYSGFTAEKIPYKYLTHILYAFYIPEPSGVIKNSDPLDEENLKKLTVLAKENGTKVMVSIGGWGQSHNFKPMAASAGTRARFIEGCLKLADKYQLDGIDLDWEFPDSLDGDNQIALHNEIRAAFDKHPRKLLFTAAVAPTPWFGQWSRDEALKKLDYLNVMTYDLMGTWEKGVIPNSGLDMSLNALKYYEDRGLPKEKLLLGSAFYGKSFDGGKAMGGTYNNIGSGANGIWLWKDLLTQFKAVNYVINWDDKTKSEYAVGNDEIIVFNGLPSQRIWGETVRNSNYAGVFMWDLLSDAPNKDQSLLVALYRGLRGTSTGPLKTPPPGPKWTHPYTDLAAAKSLAPPEDKDKDKASDAAKP